MLCWGARKVSQKTEPWLIALIKVLDKSSSLELSLLFWSWLFLISATGIWSFCGPVIAAHTATVLLGLEPSITKYFVFHLFSLQTVLVKEIASEVLYWESGFWREQPGLLLHSYSQHGYWRNRSFHVAKDTRNHEAFLGYFNQACF